MNVVDRNRAYLGGGTTAGGLFPHLENAPAAGLFDWDFGLDRLPDEAGLIAVRGPRQFGKSTWIEQQLRASIETFGPGTTAFLNGDYIAGADELEREIQSLVQSFAPEAPVRRLFIDEITAVDNWQRAVKRLADAGMLRKTLLVTTGSKAGDIQRGAELLPGRKGKLGRTVYLFAPIAYKDFHARAHRKLGADTPWAYLVCGGTPPAAAALVESGSIPEYLFQTTSDWVYGECARAGRSRPMLLRLLEQLMRRAGGPVPQTTLATESGMANNTVALGYLDLLGDLLVLGTTEPWDPSRRSRMPRKASKYPFVNLMAANTWWPRRYTSPAQLRAAAGADRGIWWEWAVAAELYRRAAKSGHPTPLHTLYWRAEDQEVDFVRTDREWIEVKAGAASALDFERFRRSFPRASLLVVNTERFRGRGVRGVTLEDFLLDEAL